MTYELVLRSTAAEDVLEAFFWYHTVRPELGEQFMLALDECYGTIRSNPKGYQERKGHFRHLMLHRFPIG